MDGQHEKVYPYKHKNQFLQISPGSSKEWLRVGENSFPDKLISGSGKLNPCYAE